jgi:hypothetical protein
VEEAAGPGREREGERVAEGIAEEELGGREHPVFGADGQDVLGVVMAVEQRPVTVDGGLGRSRRPRRVEPEGHGVGADGLGGDGARRRAPHERRELDDDRALHVVEGGVQVRVREDNPGAAVREDDVELAGGEPGVERDRDGAQLERAQEGGGEADTVMHEERHALLWLDAEPAEPAGGSVGERGELTVRIRPLGSHDGRARGQPLGEGLVDQEGGGVVDGEIGHRRSG